MRFVRYAGGLALSHDRQSANGWDGGLLCSGESRSFMANAAVYLYSKASAAWEKKAIARVYVFEDVLGMKFRVVARSVLQPNDVRSPLMWMTIGSLIRWIDWIDWIGSQVLINTWLFNGLNARIDNGVFVQWADKRWLYGLRFDTNKDASQFLKVIHDAVDQLAAATSTDKPKRVRLCWLVSLSLTLLSLGRLVVDSSLAVRAYAASRLASSWTRSSRAPVLRSRFCSATTTASLAYVRRHMIAPSQVVLHVWRLQHYGQTYDTLPHIPPRLRESIEFLETRTLVAVVVVVVVAVERELTIAWNQSCTSSTCWASSSIGRTSSSPRSSRTVRLSRALRSLPDGPR